MNNHSCNVVARGMCLFWCIKYECYFSNSASIWWDKKTKYHEIVVRNNKFVLSCPQGTRTCSAPSVYCFMNNWLLEAHQLFQWIVQKGFQPHKLSQSFFWINIWQLSNLQDIRGLTCSHWVKMMNLLLHTKQTNECSLLQWFSNPGLQPSDGSRDWKKWVGRMI